MSRYDMRDHQNVVPEGAPAATHERILLVLSMTQRPLGSGELQNALGLFTHEAREACNWLKDQGYVTSTARIGRSTKRDSIMCWSLADKGRSWAREQRALAARAH